MLKADDTRPDYHHTVETRTAAVCFLFRLILETKLLANPNELSFAFFRNIHVVIKHTHII